MKSVLEPLEVGTFDYEGGRWYYTPKELWNFKRKGDSSKSPVQTARAFLKSNHLLLGLHKNLSTLKLEHKARGLTGHHIIFRQYLGKGEYRSPLSNGIVTVHMTNEHIVYMCKCRAMPYHIAQSHMRQSSSDYLLTERKARSAALKLIRESNAPEMQPYDTNIDRSSAKVRYARQIWWPSAFGQAMSAAWKIKLTVPGAVEEWTVVLSAPSGNANEITYLQVSNNGVSYSGQFRRTGKAKIFIPNPIGNIEYSDILKDESSFLDELNESESYRDRLNHFPESAYQEVRLRGLDSSGYLNGKRVCVKVAKGHKRIRRRNLDFSDIRARAPGSRVETGFEELMVYFHIDGIVRHLEKLGYKGSRAIFKNPLIANVYWRESDGSSYDGAWYNHLDQQICFGNGELSDCEDAEVIVHEVGHAIQDAISNNFGLSEEAAAMGEGFADYLAMSFFKDSKPEIYQDTVMSWDGLVNGLRYNHTPPCQRHVHSSWYGSLHYNNFVKGEIAWKHTNGQIWAATLWEIQEQLGREVADRIILESHFELSPNTKMPRGARAIIHADRHLFAGRHESQLEEIFSKRGFPPYSHGTPRFRTHADYEFEEQVVDYAKNYPLDSAAVAASKLKLKEKRRPSNPIEMPLTEYRVKKIWERYGIFRPGNKIVEVLWSGDWYRAKILQQINDQYFVKFQGFSEDENAWVHASSTRSPQ